MSRGINKTISIGNLCADPEVRYMPNGNAVTNVRLAMNNNYKDKQTGQVVGKVEYIGVVFFNRLAEIAGEYLRKGAKIYVEGSLRTRKWQDKNSGQDRFTTEIVAAEMQMLDGQQNGAQQGQGFQQPSPMAPQNQQQRPAQGQGYQQNQAAPQSMGGRNDFNQGGFDDDIPF
ncbi:single-stranded DNA-binding protein [Microbulbifer sp. VAAF005]|uniref:single-stranded DNA-binding protein n=1 Tax=Microbulbifer sp. VAAF005 TaxID=3034230 RepID=UPI0024AD72DF|nr:single-stranded DNA-binding protein [Microbulbifer sp. VAAF005]WHI46557.1 single-stranded DNA-binding protein [Microbulbifer sp. VAAF005]